MTIETVKLVPQWLSIPKPAGSLSSSRLPWVFLPKQLISNVTMSTSSVTLSSIQKLRIYEDWDDNESERDTFESDSDS